MSCLRTFPGNAWIYILMTAIVWGHAQIGVHYIMRVRTWYARVRPVIIALFLLLPALGIAEVHNRGDGGIRAGGGRDVARGPEERDLMARRTGSSQR